jgi:putative ATPase
MKILNMDLFSNIQKELEKTTDRNTPLADRMRPEKLEELVGQKHLLAPGKPLRVSIEKDELRSIILWGPPGTGKTSLAHVIANLTHSDFIPFSAVLAGIKEIKGVMSEAERARAYGRKTILFIDEIHRFNKAQQDAFLPHVETGNIILIGATTENPSFEINAALLSRSKVYVLEALTVEEILVLLKKALLDPKKGLGADPIEITDDLLTQIAVFANGDARTAYNTLELAFQLTPPADTGKKTITAQLLADTFQRKMLLYDKSGEEHFNLISALHKSMRNSNPDATLYWLARMLESGEDPLYIARRIIRFASEDVGLADPGALSLAVSAMQAFHFIGLPEGSLALAEAAVYMATAPKSNALYAAYGSVLEDIKETLAEPVPLHLRNASTSLMKDLGYGKGYKYAHHFTERVTDMNCLPPSLTGKTYFTPSGEGYEATMNQRMKEWRDKVKQIRERAEKK